MPPFSMMTIAQLTAKRVRVLAQRVSRVVKRVRRLTDTHTRGSSQRQECKPFRAFKITRSV